MDCGKPGRVEPRPLRGAIIYGWLSATFQLLDSFLTVPLDIPSANLAGELIRSWRAQGIILAGPDASIAACALHRKLALITTNAKHFPMADLSLWSADASGNLTQWR